MTVLLVASTVLASSFLPSDRPHVEGAFEWRSEQRVVGMDFWQPARFDPPARPVSERQPRSGRAAVTSGVERWRPLVEQYFPADAVDRMLCLMGYESGGDPQAENATSSATGLFQILHSLWGPVFGVSVRSEWWDPDLNVRSARQIWDRQGYWAWAPYTRGLCR